MPSEHPVPHSGVSSTEDTVSNTQGQPQTDTTSQTALIESAPAVQPSFSPMYSSPLVGESVWTSDPHPLSQYRRSRPFDVAFPLALQDTSASYEVTTVSTAYTPRLQRWSVMPPSFPSSYLMSPSFRPTIPADQPSHPSSTSTSLAYQPSPPYPLPPYPSPPPYRPTAPSYTPKLSSMGTSTSYSTSRAPHYPAPPLPASATSSYCPMSPLSYRPTVPSYSPTSPAFSPSSSISTKTSQTYSSPRPSYDLEPPDVAYRHTYYLPRYCPKPHAGFATEAVRSYQGQNYRFAEEEVWAVPLLPIGSARPLPISMRADKTGNAAARYRWMPFRYNDLPLELKQKVLEFVFQGVEFQQSYTVVYNESFWRDVSLELFIRLPSTIKQLFVSNAFLAEALPVFAKTYTLPLLDYRWASSPPDARPKDVPITSVLPIILSQVRGVSDVDIAAFPGLSALVTGTMSKLRVLELVDKEPIYWKLQYSSWHASKLFRWGNPIGILTRSQLQAISTLSTTEHLTLPDDLHEEMKKRATTIHQQHNHPRGPHPPGTSAVCINEKFGGRTYLRFTVFGALVEDTEALDAGATGRLLAISVRYDLQNFGIVQMEEVDARKDNESYQFWVEKGSDHNEAVPISSEDFWLFT
ncbi:hypothetical protein OHC33_002253 [Knufia fluminis]|uniref:Uncharacterized protein n=1 Tax=Knufia fluminis TaxID=191047 RepID=A0AAN8IBA7_9EURO|nr:hypothetical protein OHC33_002253 [Knufia fluminis]